MNIKHFIKTLLLFAIMIVVGLLGVFLLSHFDKNENSDKLPNNINILK